MLRKVQSVLKRSPLGAQSKRSDTEPELPVVLGKLFSASCINDEQACDYDDYIKIIWLTTDVQNVDEHSFMESIRSVNNNIQVCRSKKDMLAYLESTVNEKVFIVVHCVTDILITTLEPFKQIDSIFFVTLEPPTRVSSAIMQWWCPTKLSLVNELKKACKELIQQKAAFSFVNQADWATHALHYEKCSHLFLQVFKATLLRMTKTIDAKRMMLSMCRDYYRGNVHELANIDEFERSYKSIDAITWYTKETFVYKFVNKALRTKDVDVLYCIRFYIVDLSLQIQQEFDRLKQRETEDVFHCYRALKMSCEEISAFERGAGNVISTDGYLSTSRHREVAYGFAMKSAKRAGIERVLIDYSIDLTLTKHIVFADVAQYSAFPEEGEILFDSGATFRIDSCIYDKEDDLWLVNVSANDEGAETAIKFINYHHARIGESNMALVFGHLLIEMGEYEKARKYFEVIIRSAKPTDDEIACIYHNVGRAHQLKGEYERALACLYHAYDTHLIVRPPRLMGAAKAINAIGIVYMKRGNLEQATNSFERALSLYKKSAEQCHEYIAETLINLGNTQWQQDRLGKALSSFRQAQKAYERHSSPDHQNITLVLNNIGNIRFRQQKYDLAFQAFTGVLQLREKTLPSDHPDLARAAHNLAVLYAIRGDHDQAELFFKQAATCGLPETDPFMQMVKSNMTNWKMARVKREPQMNLSLNEQSEHSDLRF